MPPRKKAVQKRAQITKKHYKTDIIKSIEIARIIFLALVTKK